MEKMPERVWVTNESGWSVVLAAKDAAWASACTEYVRSDLSDQWRERYERLAAVATDVVNDLDNDDVHHAEALRAELENK